MILKSKYMVSCILTIYILITLAVVITAKVDHYAVLGVAKNATAKEIKTAFRKLAVKWHPDKNQDKIEEARKEFSKISEAYQTLTNPQKRKEYDEGSDEEVQESDWSDQNAHDWDDDNVFEKYFGGMDADDLERSTEDNDDSGTTYYYYSSGSSNDDDGDSVSWSKVFEDNSDEDFAEKKSKKKSNQEKKTKKSRTSSLKSSRAESLSDVTDLPGTYFGPWIKDLNDRNWEILKEKKTVWVVVIFEDKSDFSAKKIKDINSFAYNHAYITVAKLRCSKNKASKKLCKTLHYYSDYPKIYLYNMYDENPRIMGLTNFSIAKLKAKIINSFEDYEFLLKKIKSSQNISSDIAMNFGTRDSRPVITLYMHEKDSIFLHTLNMQYKAELNFCLGDYEDAVNNKMDTWNSAIFEFEGVKKVYDKGGLDLDKFKTWIKKIRKQYTLNIKEFGQKSIPKSIKKKYIFIFKETTGVIINPFALTRFSNAHQATFQMYRADKDLLHNFFFTDTKERKDYDCILFDIINNQFLPFNFYEFSTNDLTQMAYLQKTNLLKMISLGDLNDRYKKVKAKYNKLKEKQEEKAAAAAAKKKKKRKQKEEGYNILFGESHEYEEMNKKFQDIFNFG